MSNATKFTDQGSIRLTVSAEPGGNEDLSVHFSLSDTGSGIPDEILSNVFDPFSAGSAKTSGRYGGGGLGLPICKGLVELMEGEISLESTVGVGTTINFWVSAAPDPEDREWAQRVANPDAGSFASEHPHHILVVDDDKVQRSILCMLLSRLGYSPDEAVNGQEAIESAINGNYDRIFMDLRMPILNGLQATEKIRELKGRGDLKIIALTGDALRETRRAAMRIGMDDFIPKPVQPEVLETLLRRGSSEEEWG
jgi:CheY-like chemotaxis protein